jgi:hypothetical protein
MNTTTFVPVTTNREKFLCGNPRPETISVWEALEGRTVQVALPAVPRWPGCGCCKMYEVIGAAAELVKAMQGLSSDTHIWMCEHQLDLD